MIEIDADKLHDLIRNSVAYQVEHTYGPEGAESLRGLLQSVRTIFTHLDIESYSGELIIFRALRPDQTVLERSRAREVPRPEDFATCQQGPLVIEAAADGRYFLWAEAADGSTLSDRALVYKFSDGSEWVYARTAEPKAVVKLAPSFKSMFAIPSFSDLTAALNRFRTIRVKNSSCKIFFECWRDENRLFFKNRPEHIMRDSLCQFLQAVIPDADILPEQNVDESHPVDIRVTWRRKNNVALVEIKWLGQSKNEDGTLATGYAEGRAKDGAQQLVDYLESHKPGNPEKSTHGYLVIVDGRRRGLRQETTHVNRADGMHFENQEITFDAAHLARPDFKAPARMFAHPICV